MTKGKAPLIERSAYSIPEFCERNNISTPTYYQLKRLGLGPTEMRLGAAIRITAHAELEWQVARENPTGAEAMARAEGEERLRRRSTAALAGTGRVTPRERC